MLIACSIKFHKKYLAQKHIDSARNQSNWLLWLVIVLGAILAIASIWQKLDEEVGMTMRLLIGLHSQ
jgi:hypothetical protein